MHLSLSLTPGQFYRSPRSADAVFSLGNAPLFEPPDVITWAIRTRGPPPNTIVPSQGRMIPAGTPSVHRESRPLRRALVLDGNNNTSSQFGFVNAERERIPRRAIFSGRLSAKGASNFALAISGNHGQERRCRVVGRAFR
jgi:hypothetical protein